MRIFTKFQEIITPRRQLFRSAILFCRNQIKFENKRMSLDRLFRSTERPFISPVINLKEFLLEATTRESRLRNFFNVSESEIITHEELSAGESTNSPFTIQDNTRIAFRQFMIQRGQTSEAADKVINNGDMVLSNVLEKYPIEDYEVTFPPKGSKLMTHRVLDNIRRRSKSSAVKNEVVRRCKYFKCREQELRRYYTERGVSADQDIMLTVHLMKPLNRSPETMENINLKHRCEVKFLIRGDMPLVNLREKIYCASDFWSNYEDFQDAPLDTSCYFIQKFQSSFIFVHDTFYLDSRHPNSSDITEPIRDFMKRKHNDFGEFFLKDMDDTRVIDLKLRLGQPYLYLHQGRCEHLLIFTDLRLLNAGDTKKLDDYPVRLYDIISQKVCVVCSSEAAAFVVTESDRLPMAPAFFCTKCFSAFHYYSDQRVGNFKAYHYVNHAGTE